MRMSVLFVFVLLAAATVEPCLSAGVDPCSSDSRACSSGFEHSAYRMDVTAASLCCLGERFRRAGEPMNAIETYRKAIMIDPLFADAHAGLAACYVAVGSFDTAVEVCSDALEIVRDAQGKRILSDMLEMIQEVKASTPRIKQANCLFRVA